MTYYTKDNKIYYIQILPNELPEHFYERVKFITNQDINNINDYDEVILYSKIHINIKYYKCEYPDKIMKIMKKFKNS